ncbi:MAG: mandelate racemase/muconate lactonizing enzyme family protein [Bacteroidales bacterium]|nr:mandelate racemase/muconate lactonizing enzyme family protein [Bacteroidales bacterium]
MDRRSFVKTSAIGYSGLVLGGLAFNPLRALSRPTNLKITDIRGCTVASNYDYPIIKIYTNQDIYGLGEVRDAGFLGQALMMKPYLIGKDPLDIESILHSIRPFTGHGRFGGGYSAIDIALMDIAGKVMGWPCYKLLGTKLRDTISVYADTFGSEDKEAFARFMEIRLKQGYKHYKMDLRPWYLEGIEGAQSGGYPTEKGLEVWGSYVERIRDVIGYKVSLGADHFGPMNIQTGIRLGEFMSQSKYCLAYIEDVYHFSQTNSVNVNKAISAGSPVPTLGFEDIFGFEGYRPFIEENAIDIIHADMLTSGGMLETKKIADYGHIFGIRTMMHCAGSPIASIAMVHCAATIQDFICLENHALEIPWWSDLITGFEKPIIRDGLIKVPEKPGLGIELNDEVMKKYLREPGYLYKSGYFEPTPEFDKPFLWQEAIDKKIIGRWANMGPWWHINDKGEYGYTMDRR